MATEQIRQKTEELIRSKTAKGSITKENHAEINDDMCDEMDRLQGAVDSIAINSKDWYITSTMIAPTATLGAVTEDNPVIDLTLTVKRAAGQTGDLVFSNLKLANGSAAPTITITEEESNEPFPFLVYDSATDSWAKDIKVVDIDVLSPQEFTGQNVTTDLNKTFTYAVENSNLKVSGVTSKAFDGTAINAVPEGGLTFNISHKSTLLIISRIGNNTAFIVNLTATNNFGLLGKIDMTTAAYSNVKTATGAGALIGDLVYAVKTATSINISINGVQRFTILLSELLSLGGGGQVFQFGFAVQNMTGLTNGSILARDIRMSVSEDVRTAMTGVTNVIDNVKSAVIVDAVQSDLTNAIDGTFTYTLTNGDIVVSGVTTKALDGFLLPDSDYISFTKTNQRSYLIIGYNNNTTYCAVNMSFGNFGGILNFNSATGTYVFIKTSSDTQVTNIGQVISAKRTGNNILVYVDGVLKLTLSISEILGLGGFAQNLRFGIAAFNLGGNTFVNGDVVAKNLTLSKIQLQKTAIETISALSKKNESEIKRISSTNPLEALKVSIMGDSISTILYGGINADTVWHGLLRNKHNWQLFVNAVSGSPVANNGATAVAFVEPNRWQLVNSTFTPDVIIIFGGTNDFLGHDVLLGTPTDSTVATFYGALNYLYSNLTTRVPTARIFHITLLHRADVGFPETNPDTGLKAEDFAKAIREKCSEFGVGLIDARMYSGLNHINMSDTLNLYSPDKLHLNAAGQKRIAQCVEGAMKLALNDFSDV